MSAVTSVRQPVAETGHGIHGFRVRASRPAWVQL
jgi:hypothetical protein